jgi:hypothetical protein
MSEPLTRLLIVFGVMLVATLVTWVVRLSARPGAGAVNVDLEPGVYLFSTLTCADCRPVHELLVKTLGVAGFSQIEWEDNRALFESLAIAVVPTTIVIGDDGKTQRVEGDPSSLLGRLSP